jgi:hypothetical protein
MDFLMGSLMMMMASLKGSLMVNNWDLLTVPQSVLAFL